jgi:hypothetical protein
MISKFSKYISDVTESNVARVTKYVFDSDIFEAIVVQVIDGSYHVFSKGVAFDGDSISFSGEDAELAVHDELMSIMLTADFCREADLGISAGVRSYEDEGNVYVDIDLKDYGIFIEALLVGDHWSILGLFLDASVAHDSKVQWLRGRTISAFEIGNYVRSILMGRGW